MQYANKREGLLGLREGSISPMWSPMGWHTDIRFLFCAFDLACYNIRNMKAMKGIHVSKGQTEIKIPKHRTKQYWCSVQKYHLISFVSLYLPPSMVTLKRLQQTKLQHPHLINLHPDLHTTDLVQTDKVTSQKTGLSYITRNRTRLQQRNRTNLHHGNQD